MSKTSHEVREAQAREAFEALGASPSEQAVLQVHCSAAHHVAAVFRTGAGPVYHSILHFKAHGRRDYEDLGHHATRLGTDWFDLLEPGPDPLVSDELPAGCECGPRTLSRALLLEQVAQGVGRVVVD